MTVLSINSNYNLQELVPARVPPHDPTKNRASHGGAVKAEYCEKAKISHSCVRVSQFGILDDSKIGLHMGGAVKAEYCEKAKMSYPCVKALQLGILGDSRVTRPKIRASRGEAVKA